MIVVPILTKIFVILRKGVVIKPNKCCRHGLGFTARAIAGCIAQHSGGLLGAYKGFGGSRRRRKFH